MRASVPSAQSAGGSMKHASSARRQPRRDFPASRNAFAPYTWHSGRMPLSCLLVDDNDAFLETARDLLDREGVQVAGVASSIAGALRQARALHPDVILVDIGLGEESGFELARLLAADGQGGRADVILISAQAETDYTDLIAESPAAGFLPKSELSAHRINQILNR
jgi:DNA-binding NarL/FixJ family response regulator